MQTVQFRLNNGAPRRELLGFWVGVRGMDAEESFQFRRFEAPNF